MRSLAVTTAFLAMALALLASTAPLRAQNAGGFRTTTQPDGLSARVEKLEEQLVDLQGVVAAVETLSKNGGGGVATAPFSGGGGASGDQVRQLAEQLADITQRLERLEAKLGGASASPSGSRPQPSYSASAPASGFEEKQPLAPLPAPSGRQTAPAFNAGGDGRTASSTRPSVSSDPQPAPARVTAQPSSSGAQALYDQGASSLSRKEYAAADGFFTQFLEQYPSDGKAGLAQYWLGESSFASGDYKAAADRFLKAFNNYQTSEKAPEALLKLAISLRRIGENTAACESFAELQKRFPQAPKSVTQRAEKEKSRANCT